MGTRARFGVKLMRQDCTNVGLDPAFDILIIIDYICIDFLYYIKY